MHVQIDEGIRSVLIVEDEGILAMMMEDLVRELGVRDVHICGDVTAALEMARTADIDCAILDLRIRGGSTIEVADILASRGVPFLFSTGSDGGALVSRHAGRPIIGKPFADDDFKRTILDTWSFARAPHGHLMADGPARVATIGATD